MKRKINILIIASLAAVIALSSVQYYLITNTFQLKKDAFINKVKSQMKFIDVNQRVESWDEAYNDALSGLLDQYQNGLLPKEKFLGDASKFIDSLNIKFTAFYEKSMEELNFKYEVNYQEQLNSVILFREPANDTILSPNSESVLLFGTELNPKTRIGFNTNKWSSNVYSDDENDITPNRSLHFEVRSESFIDIPEWRSVVLQQMIGLLSLSVVSILVVIFLFIYALRSIIKQKKISDIKTDFINNITHELNTPLATLSIATKSLHQKKVQEDQTLLKNTISTIDRQRNRLQNLINQVWNNSLGIEDIQLEKTSVVSTTFLQTLINDYRLSKNDIAIESQLEESNSLVEVDQFHMTTALLNILDNAVKYGGTEISITSKTMNNQLQVSIQDNGIGISKEQLKRVFEKFYRAENQDIHNIKGLGLGLYYVHQIVKAHEGSIVLESKLKQGTQVLINIPIKKA